MTAIDPQSLESQNWISFRRFMEILIRRDVTDDVDDDVFLKRLEFRCNFKFNDDGGITIFTKELIIVDKDES